MYSAMIDLKKMKLEDFHASKVHQRKLKPGEKVRCTFFRIKPENRTLRREHYKTTELPKEIFDGHLQTGVHRVD